MTLCMGDNKEISIMAGRDLRIMPFKAPKNRISCGIAWKKWLDNTERQFRFFRIEHPSDKKDALMIYGGKELAYLEKYLPEANTTLDEYERLKKKLNGYFVSKRSKYYERYLFNKTRQYNVESIRSYVTRLREQANDCDFHDDYEDRILEHLTQTIGSKTLIRKCLSKGWTLSQFLQKACKYEDTQLQIRTMKFSKGQDIGYMRQQQQRNHKWSRCTYCGLSGVHQKGDNCPAFGKQCYVCGKHDHFARVCHTHGYRSGRREHSRQKRPRTVKTINPEADCTKMYAGQNICMKLRNARAKKVNEIKTNGTDIPEPIQDPGLAEKGERYKRDQESNTQREYERVCDRRLTCCRISDMYEPKAAPSK